MNWQPIDTCPPDTNVLLYQPPNEYYHGHAFIVGSIRYIDGLKGRTPWVDPAAISGQEFECDITNPTHWAQLPAPPATEVPEAPTA